MTAVDPRSSAGNDTQYRLLKARAKRDYPPICHLCGGGIDLRLPANDRMAWTLDHIIPYSYGPEYVYAIWNVRPAHRSCNSRRRNKLIATKEITESEESRRSRPW